MGKVDDVGQVIIEGHADAVAMAHVLHYDMFEVHHVREYCNQQAIPVRTFVESRN